MSLKKHFLNMLQKIYNLLIKIKKKMFDIKSWKTTLIGVILLLAAIALFYFGQPVEAGICLTASLGFFSAKDSTVTGTGKDAKTANELEKE